MGDHTRTGRRRRACEGRAEDAVQRHRSASSWRRRRCGGGGGAAYGNADTGLMAAWDGSGGRGCTMVVEGILCDDGEKHLQGGGEVGGGQHTGIPIDEKMRQAMAMDDEGARRWWRGWHATAVQEHLCGGGNRVGVGQEERWERKERCKLNFRKSLHPLSAGELLKWRALRNARHHKVLVVGFLCIFGST